MSDEKQGRGRPPKDPLLSGYGETKLLSVKVPAAQYDKILFYIQQRFEEEGLHLGVSDVVRFALVKLGINGIAEGKNAVNDVAEAAEPIPICVEDILAAADEALLASPEQHPAEPVQSVLRSPAWTGLDHDGNPRNPPPLEVE